MKTIDIYLFSFARLNLCFLSKELDCSMSRQIKSALIMSDKLIKNNYANIIIAEKYKNKLSQPILLEIELTNRFNFIRLEQWILLLILITICLSFIAFACAWIV